MWTPIKDKKRVGVHVSLRNLDERIQQTQKAEAHKAEAQKAAIQLKKARAEAEAKAKAGAEEQTKARADAEAMAKAWAKVGANWGQEVEDYVERVTPAQRDIARAEALDVGPDFKVWISDGYPYFYDSMTNSCFSPVKLAEFVRAARHVTLREAMKVAVRDPGCGPLKK